MLTQSLQYREDFLNRPLQVVILHDVRRQFVSPSQFLGRDGEAPLYVFFGISPGPQASFEFVHRGGEDQDYDGGGIGPLHLFSTLDLDFEQYVAARGRSGQRCAVEVAVEFGPLEESMLANRILEGRAVHEVVFGAVLIGPP